MKEKIYPTLKDIYEAHAWKKDYERYMPLSRYIYRPIGFLFTWVAVRLRISTEMASYVSGVLGAAGLILLVSKNAIIIISGIIMLHLFNLFDCVDGSIARVMKTENPYGKFLDSVIGDAINFCFFPVVGVMIFRDRGLSFCRFDGPVIDPTIWTIIGGIAAISYIFLQHTENIYDLQLRKSWDNFAKGDPHDYREKTESDHRDKSLNHPSNLPHLFRLIDRNLRVRETHYFILIFAYCLRFIDLYLIFFLIYFLFRVLFAIYMFGRRALIIKRRRL